MKNKKCLASILLVWVLVATSMIVVFPLSAPKAKGQVIHDLPNTFAEDNLLPYDINPTVGIVVWDPTQSHIITTDYAVWPGDTLNIPALNFTPPSGQPGELTIAFQFPASRIDVFGTPGNPGRLITQDNGNQNDHTAFLGLAPMFWDGIYFHSNSEGCIEGVYINHSMNGIVFEPGSNLISPGVYNSRIRTYGNQGMFLNGVLGYTNIQNTRFVGTSGTSGTGLVVKDCMLNLTGGIPGVRFEGHSPGTPALNVSDADVYADTVVFDGNFIPGTSVYIEGKSNATVLSECTFIDGAVDYHYIEANGSSPLITDCSFEQSGQLTIIANDNASGVPAHPILRNPLNYLGDPFINTTLNATGASSVTLQWYLDVYVIDPDDNPIGGSIVTVNSTAPGMPSSKITETSGPDIGWARGFTPTEFILYSTYVINYNPLNASATNSSLIGYAIPEVTMDMSKEITIVVPSSPSPPPVPSPPLGLQAKLAGSVTHVMLSWNASADDGKGENDVVGYTVYKSIIGVNGTYDFAAWINANGSASYNWTDLNAGDGDWNDYFYIVRANDTLDNEEQNNNKAGKFVNYLVDGWNLISVPLIQINTSKEYVLQTIEGNYVTIQGYHAGKSRPWLHWHRGKPNYFNDVIEINHKDGYYIDMLIPDYLVVAGKVPVNTQISLKTGWNLVGYPCLVNKTRDDALSSIAGKYNMVEFYDTVKDKEVKLGPNDYMKPGLGYWIHATEDCVWEI